VKIFKWLWLAWAGAFFAIEMPAVLNKAKDDSLSEQLRDIFHTKTKTGRTVWGVVFGIFAGLFAPHISGSGYIDW